MKYNNTYTIFDIQEDKIIGTYYNLDDLRVFANELFWDEEIDFAYTTEEDVFNAIKGCGYDIL